MLELSDKPVYRFADVEVDTPQGCIRRGGQEVHLREQSFSVLLYLLERRGRMVTKEELFEHIWGGAAVSDNALTQCVLEIRRSLGDDSRPYTLLKNFPKKGYRFVGPVEVVYPEGGATIEVEEITAIRIEYEREVAAEGSPLGVAGRRQFAGAALNAVGGAAAEALTLRPRASVPFRTRLALAGCGLAALVLAALLAFQGAGQPADEQRREAVSVSPHAPGRRVLVVTFFENRTGDPQADWLREGLADMLITELSGSQGLAVLSRQQLHLLLERAGHLPGQDIRLDEALGVARGVAAEVILTGSFARVGEKVRVDAQLYDARSGQMLAAEQTVADEAGLLFTQLGILSAKLTAHLGQPAAAAGGGARLAAALTDNLEAYRYYSLAVEKARGMQSREAIELLERAVRLDPEFAMAHARIGYAYAVTWNFPDKGKPYLERAFKLSGRLTEKDRLYIAAWYAIAEFDYPGAIKAFREIVARYPLEVEAYQRLVRLLRAEGRHEEAVEAARQALAVDAGAAELYNALGLTYSELGRHDEAIAMLRRYVELAPGEPNAHDSLGMGYQWAGRYAEAVEEYERALALAPGFDVALVHLGNAYFQQGRYREAVETFQRYVEAAPSDGERARGHASIAYVQLRKGEFDEAKRAARVSLRYANFGLAYFVALGRGDLVTAEAATQEYEARLNKKADRGARFSPRESFWLRGHLALRRGQAAEAVENFSAAVRHRPLGWHLDPLEDCLANAYLELGRLDEAVAEYERILRLNPHYPLASYHLGQAYERQGRRGPAAAAYQQFLRTWHNADADLPEVADARNRLEGAR